MPWEAETLLIISAKTSAVDTRKETHATRLTALSSSTSQVDGVRSIDNWKGGQEQCFYYVRLISISQLEDRTAHNKNSITLYKLLGIKRTTKEQAVEESNNTYLYVIDFWHAASSQLLAANVVFSPGPNPPLYMRRLKTSFVYSNSLENVDCALMVNKTRGNKHTAFAHQRNLTHDAVRRWLLKVLNHEVRHTESIWYPRRNYYWYMLSRLDRADPMHRGVCCPSDLWTDSRPRRKYLWLPNDKFCDLKLTWNVFIKIYPWSPRGYGPWVHILQLGWQVRGENTTAWKTIRESPRRTMRILKDEEIQPNGSIWSWFYVKSQSHDNQLVTFLNVQYDLTKYLLVISPTHLESALLELTRETS